MTKKVLLVTGGGRGIGAEIARIAAGKGYAVAVNYGHARERAEALVQDLRGAGGEAVAIQADMAVETDIVRLFEGVDSSLGPVTHLINNAGITGLSQPVAQTSTEALHALFAVNVYGYFLCAREASRRMSTREGGRGGVIVNISSAAARLGGMANMVAYAASKGAVDSFTTGLGKELAPHGIRVVGLRPGVTRTEILDPQGGDPFIDEVAKTIPIGRAAEASEIAAAAVWLLSDEASYMTCTTIDVTGGR